VEVSIVFFPFRANGDHDDDDGGDGEEEGPRGEAAREVRK